jgi:hypothetical protein
MQLINVNDYDAQEFRTILARPNGVSRETRKQQSVTMVSDDRSVSYPATAVWIDLEVPCSSPDQSRRRDQGQ